MLIISGSAQCILDRALYKKGDLHTITLFSINEDFDNSLTDIESYLNKMGWDDIVIEETQIIDNSNDFDHNVLKEGFEKAQKQNYALVVHNEPVSVIDVA